MTKKRNDDSIENKATGAGAAGKEAQNIVEDCAACAAEDEIARQMQALAEQAGKAARERDEYLNLAQRVQADFDNYRRRNQCAREDAYGEGVRDTLIKFLPVLDNLDRAAGAAGGADALREGVQLVLKQLNTALASAGVQEIEADGKPFDPNLHDAVMQEAAQGVHSGTVIAVLQKGFTHCGKVLRHSMVKVSE